MGFLFDTPPRPEPTVVKIRWIVETMPISGGKLGRHSALVFDFSNGVSYVFEKSDGVPNYIMTNLVGSIFRPYEDKDVWLEVGRDGLASLSLTRGRIEEIGKELGHYNDYRPDDFNCHNYAQDVWNKCVTFWNQKWTRPDFLKCKALKAIPGGNDMLYGALDASR